ncbi:DUF1572 family protein [Rhodohalobacter sulfatireducens]|uniref:DUF1572 domain-containing protein n=1 Tax=Rhodohalobacter sulfatireducens TaxID=2911366 RepID=A0ABS9KCF1_9BACT|nr:DUF1572 family protein [Rhodohalobacter sulfatireducens]MCG2588524.1 DUF1572 domain-containing protein [Rhodohalobacter sulfatireducens]
MNKSGNRLDGINQLFKYYKSLTEKSIEQISNEQVHKSPKPGQNSIAILMKHLAGNMISRWTNFRKEDGEKPWRDRETEFIDDFESAEELKGYWEKGWGVLFDALESIDNDELDSIIYIRNDGHKLIEAVERHLAHVAYHSGQIVYLAKMYSGDDWQSLSIPKGKTEEYNRKKFNREKGRRIYTDRT